MGQIYTPELNGQSFIYLWKEASNNNAYPDEEIQLPCVWTELVVGQATADIMRMDGAQTTLDGGWEVVSRRAKSWGTLTWWCSQCVTLSSGGWMDLDVFVRSCLSACRHLTADEATLITLVRWMLLSFHVMKGCWVSVLYSKLTEHRGCLCFLIGAEKFNWLFNWR